MARAPEVRRTGCVVSDCIVGMGKGDGWWLTGGAAAADGEAAEAEEGDGKGHDVGGDVADDHDLIRVGGDEF